jgi:hypothetical protein
VYNWATLSLGDINTEAWSARLGVGRKADDLAVQKKSYCYEIERKTGCNLAESCKEGNGSKRVIFPMMIMNVVGGYLRFGGTCCFYFQDL